jgi:TolB-like protein
MLFYYLEVVMSRIIAGLFVLVCVGANIGYSQTEKKPTVAVVEFEIRGDVQIKDAGISIAEMLSVSLVKTGVYNLYERILMEKVLDEQKLGIAQIVNAESAAKVGEMFGVNFLITGSVIEWDKVYTVTVRMIDTSTGKIVNSASFQVSKSSSIPGKMDDLADVLVGRKNQEILNSKDGISVEYQKKTQGLGIILEIRKNGGDKLVINLGSEQNVKPGMIFDVFINKYKISEITGQKTYDGLEKAGELYISSVDPTMSIGSLYMAVGKGSLVDTLTKEGVVNFHFPASSALTVGIVNLNTPFVSYDFSILGFFMGIGMGYAIPDFMGNVAGSLTFKFAYGFNVLRTALDVINLDIRLTMLMYSTYDYKSADQKFMKLSLGANVTFLNLLYAGAGAAYTIDFGDKSGFGVYFETGVTFPLF